MAREPVWLETWEAHPRCAHGHAFLTFGRGLGASLHGEAFPEARAAVDIDRPTMLARAKLASAAPELARLMLDILDRSLECPSCGALIHLYPPGDPRADVHESDCELYAALRKAGLRP